MKEEHNFFKSKEAYDKNRKRGYQSDLLAQIQSNAATYKGKNDVNSKSYKDSQDRDMKAHATFHRNIQ